MKYLERRKARLDGKNEEKEDKFINGENKAQMNVDLIATERKVDTYENLLDKQLSADKLDSIKILNTKDELAKAKTDVKTLTELIKELF